MRTSTAETRAKPRTRPVVVGGDQERPALLEPAGDLVRVPAARVSNVAWRSLDAVVVDRGDGLRVARLGGTDRAGASPRTRGSASRRPRAARATSSSAFSVRPISAVSCARRARIVVEIGARGELAELLVQVVERALAGVRAPRGRARRRRAARPCGARGAAELGEEHGERVLAGDLVAVAVEQLEPVAVVQRLAAARRRARATAASRIAGPRSAGSSRARRRASRRGLGARREPVEQPAARVDLGESRARSARAPRAARRPRASSRARWRSSVGPLGGDGADEAGGRTHRRRFYTVVRTVRHVGLCRACAYAAPWAPRRRCTSLCVAALFAATSGLFGGSVRRPAGPYPAPRGSP